MVEKARPIKFRAWDKTSRTMLLANLHLNLNDSSLWIIEEDYIGPDEIYCQYVREAEGDIILMQYTGLKDSNGIEIFEGDIVKLWGLEPGYAFTSDSIVELPHNYEVKYSDCMFNILEMRLDSWEQIEVIGNIYENPELLEDE